MEEVKIYSKRLASFMVENGQQLLETTNDNLIPGHYCWIFKRTENTNNLIDKYQEQKRNYLETKKEK